MSNKKTLPKSISIAVIVYHEDFKLYQRLMDSIFKFWNKSQIQTIYVVFNDHLRYFDQFRKLTKQYIKNKDIEVKIITPSDLDVESDQHDWCTQQYYKLIVSKYITTEWFLIHDCKDYYIEPVAIEDMFLPTGQATMQLDHLRYPSGSNPAPPSKKSYWTPGPFQHALINSYKIFGINATDYKTWHLPTVTPFIVHTQTTKDLVHELETRLGHLFPMIFHAHIDGELMVTEFLLYGAYCTSKDTLNILYADWFSNHKSYFMKIKQSKDLRITGNRGYGSI